MRQGHRPGASLLSPTTKELLACPTTTIQITSTRQQITACDQNRQQLQTIKENESPAYEPGLSAMHLLLITNLYPPQELGGYGRCMADFAWGLQQRGHKIQVLSSNAPYLGEDSSGPSGEPVDRRLMLKGSFHNGVEHLQDSSMKHQIDINNRNFLNNWIQRRSWDGILIGNLDLLGPELLEPLLSSRLPLLHHIGFVTPPYAPEQMPSRRSNYRLLTASATVRSWLKKAGMDVEDAGNLPRSTG